MSVFRKKQDESIEGNYFYMQGDLSRTMEKTKLLFNAQSFKEMVVLGSDAVPDLTVQVEINFTAAYFPHFDRNRVRLRIFLV